VLEDEVLAVGVACVVDEPDEPSASDRPQRTTASTAARPRRKLTAMPSVPVGIDLAGEPQVPLRTKPGVKPLLRRDQSRSSDSVSGDIQDSERCGPVEAAAR
jgi:hypothetical protein